LGKGDEPGNGDDTGTAGTDGGGAAAGTAGREGGTAGTGATGTGATGDDTEGGGATGVVSGGGATLGERMPGVCAFCETLIDFKAKAVAVVEPDIPLLIPAPGGAVLGRAGGALGTAALPALGGAAAVRDDGGEAAAAPERRPGVAGPGPGTPSNCGGGPTAGAGASAS
jgi:hypothetical protein